MSWKDKRGLWEASQGMTLRGARLIMKAIVTKGATDHQFSFVQVEKAAARLLVEVDGLTEENTRRVEHFTVCDVIRVEFRFCESGKDQASVYVDDLYRCEMYATSDTGWGTTRGGGERYGTFARLIRHILELDESAVVKKGWKDWRRTEHFTIEIGGDGLKEHVEFRFGKDHVSGATIYRDNERWTTIHPHDAGGWRLSGAKERLDTLSQVIRKCFSLTEDDKVEEGWKDVKKRKKA